MIKLSSCNSYSSSHIRTKRHKYKYYIVYDASPKTYLECAKCFAINQTTVEDRQTIVFEFSICINYD